MSTFEPQLPVPHGRRRPKLRLFGRMFIGCLLVVAAVAGTLATGALLEVKTFTDYLRQSPQLKLGSLLTKTNAGWSADAAADRVRQAGEDGDRRELAAALGHDDPRPTRPEPAETTMLSIPRDLKVTIHPDHSKPTVQKINAAYTIGGDKLTVKTIKQVLGISINHVIDINFLGFKELVNYLGCVFVQVDRRYYHSNLGLAPGQTYDEINIQPGYQRLCGDDALHYVRYRHTDTDLVRSARQQDFLRQIKNQLGASRADRAAQRHREDLRQVRHHRHQVRPTTCSSCSSWWCSRPRIRSGRSSSTPRSDRPTSPPAAPRSSRPSTSS